MNIKAAFIILIAVPVIILGLKLQYDRNNAREIKNVRDDSYDFYTANKSRLLALANPLKQLLAAYPVSHISISPNDANGPVFLICKFGTGESGDNRIECAFALPDYSIDTRLSDLRCKGCTESERKKIIELVADTTLFCIFDLARKIKPANTLYVVSGCYSVDTYGPFKQPDGPVKHAKIILAFDHSVVVIGNEYERIDSGVYIDEELVKEY